MIPNEFKIIINNKEVLSYDFSYCEGKIYSVLGAISIKMAQLGYNLPVYVKNSIVVPGWGPIRVGLPNCLYFKSDDEVDLEKVKIALDEVKENYLSINKDLNQLFS